MLQHRVRRSGENVENSTTLQFGKTREIQPDQGRSDLARVWTKSSKTRQVKKGERRRNNLKSQAKGKKTQKALGSALAVCFGS